MPKAQVFLEKPKTHYPNCSKIIKIGDESFEYDEVFSSLEEVTQNIVNKCVSSFIHGQSIVVIGTDTNEIQANYTNAIINRISQSTSSEVRYYKDDIYENDITKIKETLKRGDEVCLCSIKEFTPEFVSTLENITGDIYEQFIKFLKYVHFNNSVNYRRFENSEQLFIFRLIKHIDYCFQDSILFYANLNINENKSPLLLNTLPILHNIIMSDKIGQKPISDNKGILINALYENTSATYIIVKLDTQRLTFEDIKRIHYFTCRDYQSLNDVTNVLIEGTPSEQSLNNKIELLSEKLRKERKDHAKEKESMELVLRKDIVNEVLSNHKEYLHRMEKTFEETLKEIWLKETHSAPIDGEKIFASIMETVLKKMETSMTKSNDLRSKSMQTDAAFCDNVYQVNELAYRLKKFDHAFKTQYTRCKEMQKSIMEHSKMQRELKQALVDEKASKSYLASQVLLLQDSTAEYKRQLEEKIGEFAEQRMSYTNEMERLREQQRDSHLELQKANLAKDEMTKKHADEVRSLRNLFLSNYSPVPQGRPNLDRAPPPPHVTADDDPIGPVTPNAPETEAKRTTRVTRSAKKQRKEK